MIGNLNKTGIPLIAAAFFALSACSSPTAPAIPPGYVPASDPLPSEVSASMAANGIARENVLVRDACYYIYGGGSSVTPMKTADGETRICVG